MLNNIFYLIIFFINYKIKICVNREIYNNDIQLKDYEVLFSYNTIKTL